MKIIKFFNVIVIFSLFLLNLDVKADKGQTVCKTPNPKSVDAVYQCITQSSINGINMFAQIEKMDCARIRGFYVSALRRSWADAELVKNPPSCAVFARVVKELTGKDAFWHGCMNYTDTQAHLSRCFAGRLDAVGVVNHQVLGQCQLALLFYESAVRSASDPTGKKQGLLPENYQKPSCDRVKSALESIDIKLAGSECLNFDNMKPEEHVKQCLKPEFLSGKVTQELDCNQIRQFYQTKVLRSYGRLPPGFSMLRCSVLTKVSGELYVESKKELQQQNESKEEVNEVVKPKLQPEKRGRRSQSRKTYTSKGK